MTTAEQQAYKTISDTLARVVRERDEARLQVRGAKEVNEAQRDTIEQLRKESAAKDKEIAALKTRYDEPVGG